MNIELLLSHPKQVGGHPDYQRSQLVVRHLQLQRAALRCGSGYFAGLELLCDALAGTMTTRSKTESETSADSTDTFSVSSKCDDSDDLDEMGAGAGAGVGTRMAMAVKPKRKRASRQQLEVLRGTFQQTPFPASEVRRQLARELGMTARSVQIWFQNQRQLARNTVSMKSAACAGR